MIESERAVPNAELQKARVFMDELLVRGVDSVLYGSLGVSVYLGKFKGFGDIDLLVGPDWMNEQWQDLQKILSKMGYELVNDKEHEFTNTAGETVAFAPMTIFERDGIEFDVDRDIVRVTVDGGVVTTFTPELFLRAYEYSVNDGYRTKTRNKKDQLIIDRLKTYIV